jgi:hypothetical protein
MQEFRTSHTVLNVNNVVYVLGGYSSPCNKYLKSCEKYSVLEDRWSQIAEMKEQKANVSAIYYQ